MHRERLVLSHVLGYSAAIEPETIAEVNRAVALSLQHRGVDDSYSIHAVSDAAVRGVDFTTDLSNLHTALHRLHAETTNSHRLYDAACQAVDKVLSKVGNRAVIVLAFSEDRGSNASLEKLIVKHPTQRSQYI